jgi:hypothetical protein
VADVVAINIGDRVEIAFGGRPDQKLVHRSAG